MFKDSLKQHLYDKIKNDTFGFVSLDELFSIGKNYRNSNVERRLRELREAGLIERVMSKGVVIGYTTPKGKMNNNKPVRPVDYRKANGLI